MFKHKKLASIFILAAMLLTLLPTAGFAEELESSAPSSEVTDISTAPTIADTDERLAVDTDAPTPPSDFVTGSAPADTDSTENDQDNNDSHSDSSQADSNINSNNNADDKKDDSSLEADSAEKESSTAPSEGSNDSKQQSETEKEVSAKMPLLFKAPAKHELTVYHILTTDGEALSDNDAFQSDDRYIYDYQIEHLTYSANYKFPSIEDLVAGKATNTPWSKYWQAPQAEWQLTNYTPLTTMPDNNAYIKLYYKLDDSLSDVRYNTPSGNLWQIKVDGLHAFCLNKDRANPVSYKNIPYKAPIPFSQSSEYSEATERLLSNILLLGYPCDAMGYQEKYGVSAFSAEELTQNLIWSSLNQVGAPTDAYSKAIYDTAQKMTNKQLSITYDDLTLANDAKSLDFIEQENGVFATNPVTFQGCLAAIPDAELVLDKSYRGPVALSLPNTMAVYTVEGKILDPAQIPIDTPIVFTSTIKPTMQSLQASYRFLKPSLYFYEAYITGFPKDDSAHINNAKGFQNLIAYDTSAEFISTSFPITVTELDKPVIPILPIDPIDPGNGGGGDYTPDTPSTPSEPTPPAETIIEEDTTPLAEAPEMTPSVEVPAEEVTLAEDPVPLAPAAPTSDNPKTGHPVHVIFILQVCLLLAAGALLLNDVRQYKTK